MRKEQLDEVLKLYVDRWSIVKISVYAFNSPHMKILFCHRYFMQSFLGVFLG